MGQKNSCYIPANSHTLGVSLTPAGWKLQSHTGSCLRPISRAWLKYVSCCRLPWRNFQKYVNSDPCKEWKPCVKWMNDNTCTFLAISDFWSEKHWERAHVYTRSKTGTGISDIFGRLQTSLGIFGNDRVIFKDPNTPSEDKNLTPLSQKKLAGIQLGVKIVKF